MKIKEKYFYLTPSIKLLYTENRDTGEKAGTGIRITFGLHQIPISTGEHRQSHPFGVWLSEKKINWPHQCYQKTGSASWTMNSNRVKMWRVSTVPVHSDLSYDQVLRPCHDRVYEETAIKIFRDGSSFLVTARIHVGSVNVTTRVFITQQI